MADDVARVIGNIKNIFARRKAQVYALCLYYAALAINYFRAEQSAGAFWSNQTGQARDRMFTGAYQEEIIVAWFMAHGVQYGVYLELANSGAHEAIRPTIQRFIGRFHTDLEKLYGGS